MSQLSGAALGQRLSAFRDQFKKVLGPKRQGYGELGVNEPLVGSDGDQGHASSNDYTRQHGVAPPGSGADYRAQRGYTGSAITGSAADVPSQARTARMVVQGLQHRDVLFHVMSRPAEQQTPRLAAPVRRATT